jgi:uncharacterized protein (TIGR03084 family)
MPDDFAQLIADLSAERGVLDGVLKQLPSEAWDRPSPAEGWLLRDCVVHLAETDESAAAIVEGVERAPGTRRNPEDGVVTAGMLQGREMAPAEVHAWWRRAGDRLLDALDGTAADARLTWAGRTMSARSFVSARLMEHWSHGLDILDAAGIQPVDTDRLRHIAHLGYMTRDFAYRTHGMTPPGTPLYVKLAAPSGAVWTWGPGDAPDRIFGSAGDFCRVVTQRIHPSDTSLRAEGKSAGEFLTIAQAFAGPPGTGRPPKNSQ